MEFEERKKAAASMVQKFLLGFSVPRGLPHEQQATRIAAIADAFARRMPTKGDYAASIDAVFSKIRDTHISNSWPAQAVFVMAMPQGEYVKPRAAETFAPKHADVAAKMMEEGQPVAERYVWGASAAALVSSGQVPRAIMDRYRDASVRGFRETYGKNALGMMVDKIGMEVEPYFRSHEPQQVPAE